MERAIKYKRILLKLSGESLGGADGLGMMSESVMATVNRRFPGTAYAFQERPLGTGDAARKGAEILERMKFEGAE